MRALLIIPLLLLGGCLRNACQDLCYELSDYAEECGFEFSKEELRTCVSDHGRGDLERETIQTCAANASAVRDEWTCDDMEDYFKDDASSADSSAAADSGVGAP